MVPLLVLLWASHNDCIPLEGWPGYKAQHGPTYSSVWQLPLAGGWTSVLLHVATRLH